MNFCIASLFQLLKKSVRVGIFKNRPIELFYLVKLYEIIKLSKVNHDSLFIFMQQVMR